MQSLADPADFKLAASCCHDRFCLPCGRQRAAIVAANVSTYLTNTATRFITLTLKADNSPLAVKLDKLYDAWKRLKRTDLWKKTQRGGAVFLEVKTTKDESAWHPHFHIIAQGRYIDARLLSHAWKNITGDSFIVDVRLLKSTADAINYVTKYASKPFDPSIFRTPERLDETILALKSRRMIMSFGNWKGLQLTEKPTEQTWQILDTLDAVLAKAAHGDPLCAKVVTLLIPFNQQALLLDLAYPMLNTHTRPPPLTPSEQLTFTPLS
jgi:hypothetical protein